MLEIIAMGALSLICGGLIIRVLSVIGNACSDWRYYKIRTEYIRSITVNEWLDLDIETLCSKSRESGYITVGYRTGIEYEVNVYTWVLFSDRFRYLRVMSPTRMFRCKSTRNYFIDYKIDGLPNLVDAYRLLKL